jgi:hypothetical protein
MFVVMVMQQQQRLSQLNGITITRIKISIIITISHTRNGKDKNVFVQKIGGVQRSPSIYNCRPTYPAVRTTATLLHKTVLTQRSTKQSHSERNVYYEDEEKKHKSNYGSLKG